MSLIRLLKDYVEGWAGSTKKNKNRKRLLLQGMSDINFLLIFQIPNFLFWYQYRSGNIYVFIYKNNCMYIAVTSIL